MLCFIFTRKTSKNPGLDKLTKGGYPIEESGK